MIEIVPAIIAKDFEELKSKIKLVEPYVSWVQLDVMDGKFALEKTWNDPGKLKNLDVSTNIEVHLMVKEPEKVIGKWLDSGVKRILVHWEAIADDLRFQTARDACCNCSAIKKIYDLREKLSEKGVEFGIVLNLETPVDVLDEFLNRKSLFLIQLMSIGKIGRHGHPFDEKVIHKIKALREKYSDVKIAVDGGINLQTAQLAAAAGADILAVGSAVFNSENIETTIKQLKEICV